MIKIEDNYTGVVVHNEALKEKQSHDLFRTHVQDPCIKTLVIVSRLYWKRITKGCHDEESS